MRVCGVITLMMSALVVLTSCTTNSQQRRVAAKSVDSDAVVNMTAAANRFVTALSDENKKIYDEFLKVWDVPLGAVVQSYLIREE